MPVAIPVTTPDVELTVADALLLDHTPPATASDKAVVRLVHKKLFPVIAFGARLINTGKVAKQPLPNVYVIVATPLAAGVITPDELIGATPGSLLVHVPPDTALLILAVTSEQIAPVYPVNVGEGDALTVTVTVERALQGLTTL